MRNIAILSFAIAAAIGVGAVAEAVVDRVEHKNAGTHRVLYEHCTSASRSDAVMRKYGYELISTEDMQDHNLQHWALKRQSADMPARVDIDKDDTNACFTNVEWH